MIELQKNGFGWQNCGIMKLQISFVKAAALSELMAPYHFQCE